MHLDKPPFLPKSQLIFKFIGITIGLIASFLLLRNAVLRGDRYLAVCNDALVLEATVVGVDESYDPESSSDYYTVIGYTYQGKYYEINHNRYATYAKAESHMGETVTIRVDPENPGDTVGSISEECAITSFFGVMILCLVCSTLCGPFRVRYVQAYGWNRSTVEKDLPIVLRHNHRYLSLLIPTMVGMLLLWRYREFVSIILWVINSVVMAVGLCILLSYLRKLRLIKEGCYTFRKDTLTNKRSTYDSEDGTVYYLEFSNGEQTWETRVREKVYNSMQVGDRIDTVYLQGAKQPLLEHSHHGEFD